MRELVRYIHLNPLRASPVQDIATLRGYPRCGHSALMGKRNWEWQDTGYVLRLFGARLRAARRSYERFIAEGVGHGRKSELVGGGLIRSAGGWSAIKALRRSGMRIMGDERILGSKRDRLTRTNMGKAHFHFFQLAPGSEAALGRRSAARFQK